MADDDSFDRLFTTSDERGQLNSLRFSAEKVEAKSANNSSIKEELSIVGKNNLYDKDKAIEISGVVIRPDGKKTVWVNRKTISPGHNLKKEVSGLDSVEVFNDNSVTVSLGKEKQRLKIGQTWVSQGGKVIETFEKNNKEILDR